MERICGSLGGESGESGGGVQDRLCSKEWSSFCFKALSISLVPRGVGVREAGRERTDRD